MRNQPAQIHLAQGWRNQSIGQLLGLSCYSADGARAAATVKKQSKKGFKHVVLLKKLN
jgi:hypothetical protein